MLIMEFGDKVNDEKLQYNINRETAKPSALSSGKIDKYEFFTREEVLVSSQRHTIEQDNFSYFLLGKGFEKQKKAIKDQRINRQKL